MLGCSDEFIVGPLVVVTQPGQPAGKEVQCILQLSFTCCFLPVNPGHMLIQFGNAARFMVCRVRAQDRSGAALKCAEEWSSERRRINAQLAVLFKMFVNESC